MHFYFLTRGVKQQQKLFEMFMQTQMFPWKRKNLKTGKEEIIQVQGSLRPINLYEYVFPEESLDEVLSMLEVEDDKGGQGISPMKQKIIRKALGKGIKKIPKYKKIPTLRYIEKRGIALYPIGIKKDKRLKKEEWGYEQEML